MRTQSIQFPAPLRGDGSVRFPSPLGGEGLGVRGTGVDFELTRNLLPLFFFLFAILAALFFSEAMCAEAYPDGQYPPPKPPELQWDDLLAGKLEDHWSDMNTAIHSPTYTLKADPDNPKGQVLLLDRHPTGLLRSMKYYENFILECDWRHLTEAPSSAGTKDTTGNSGLYVWADPMSTVGGTFTRAIEVQVCNLGNGKWYTSHGDLFPIWGAKMTPDPRFGINGHRSMPIEFRGKKTGEWNHIRVTCVDGTIQEEVNGAVVSAGYRSSPRKGYICIESEGGPIEFRNMRIHELAPDAELKEKDVAVLWPVGTVATCLYNGVNLDGCKLAEGQQDLWNAADHVLKCAGKTAGDGLDILLPIQTGDPDFTLQVDWTDEKELPFTLEGLGTLATPHLAGIPEAKKGWNRALFAYHAHALTLTINGQKLAETAVEPAAKPAPRLRLKNPGHPVSFSNLMLIEPPKPKADTKAQ